MSSSQESPTHQSEQPRRRRTDAERAAELERQAEEIRAVARLREARVRDPRISKLEAAARVLVNVDKVHLAAELHEVKMSLVDEAVPQ